MPAAPPSTRSSPASPGRKRHPRSSGRRTSHRTREREVLAALVDGLSAKASPKPAPTENDDAIRPGAAKASTGTPPTSSPPEPPAPHARRNQRSFGENRSTDLALPRRLRAECCPVTARDHRIDRERQRAGDSGYRRSALSGALLGCSRSIGRMRLRPVYTTTSSSVCRPCRRRLKSPTLPSLR